MPSVSSYRREHCATCNESTLHTMDGCIHCGTAPKNLARTAKPDEPTRTFNNQRREDAKARVARLSARANARIPGGVDIEIVTRYAAGEERKDIARALGLDSVKVGNRLEAMRSRLKLASVTDFRRPNVLTAEQGGEA